MSGLVVLDIAPVEYSVSQPHWRGVTDLIRILCDAPKCDTKRDMEHYLKFHIPDPAIRAFCLTNFHDNDWTIPIHTIQNQLDELSKFDGHGQQQYHGDAFFVHGGQSKFVGHAHLDAIATYFPNHMLTTIKGAGHWIHAEAPEATTALLQKYLDR